MLICCENCTRWYDSGPQVNDCPHSLENEYRKSLEERGRNGNYHKVLSAQKLLGKRVWFCLQRDRPRQVQCVDSVYGLVTVEGIRGALEAHWFTEAL